MRLNRNNSISSIMSILCFRSYWLSLLIICGLCTTSRSLRGRAAVNGIQYSHWESGDGGTEMSYLGALCLETLEWVGLFISVVGYLGTIIGTHCVAFRFSPITGLIPTYHLGSLYSSSIHYFLMLEGLPRYLPRYLLAKTPTQSLPIAHLPSYLSL